MLDILRKLSHYFVQNDNFYSFKYRQINYLNQDEEFAFKTLGSLILLAADQDFYTEIGFSNEILRALLRTDDDIVRDIENTESGRNFMARNRSNSPIDLSRHYFATNIPLYWLRKGRYDIIRSDRSKSIPPQWTPEYLNEMFTASQPFDANDWLENGIVFDIRSTSFSYRDRTKLALKKLGRTKCFEFYKKMTGYKNYPKYGIVRGVSIVFCDGYNFQRRSSEKLACVCEFDGKYHYSEDYIEEFLYLS